MIWCWHFSTIQCHIGVSSRVRVSVFCLANRVGQLHAVRWPDIASRRHSVWQACPSGAYQWNGMQLQIYVVDASFFLMGMCLLERCCNSVCLRTCFGSEPEVCVLFVFLLYLFVCDRCFTTWLAKMGGIPASALVSP